VTQRRNVMAAVEGTSGADMIAFAQKALDRRGLAA
jgi:hypothetical protein